MNFKSVVILLFSFLSFLEGQRAQRNRRGWKIYIDHTWQTVLVQLVWTLDDSQGPSQLHDNNPLLMCEVALG